MTVPGIPAEVFSPGEFIRDKIKARGLTEREFEVYLFSQECTPAQVFACQLAAYVDDKDLFMDADTAACLGRAFNTSADYWINLDRAWRGKA